MSCIYLNYTRLIFPVTWEDLKLYLIVIYLEILVFEVFRTTKNEKLEHVTP